MREKDLELLRTALQEIKCNGWIKNQRPGNQGGVGNTLEDLLDIAENNLQLPDFGTWEIKSQRRNTGSLLTLFHSEPSPREARLVPRILLPMYGWPHQEAGIKYPEREMSFRQTITATNYSSRGFKVNVDWQNQCVFISFNFFEIDDSHAQWRDYIRDGVGIGDIRPNPYWTFDEIAEKLETKLNNLIYIKAETKRINGEEFFHYNEIEAYIDPTLDRFLELIEAGVLYVDFDARTGHNHGTKFRIRQAARNDLYQRHVEV